MNKFWETRFYILGLNKEFRLMTVKIAFRGEPQNTARALLLKHCTHNIYT